MTPTPVEVVFALPISSSASTALAKSDIFSYQGGQTKAPGPWKRGRPKGSGKEKITRRKAQRDETSISHSQSSFEFIHLSPRTKNIDKRSLTRIRSHVQRSRGEGGSFIKNRDQHYRNVPADVSVGRHIRGFINCYNLRQIDGVDPFDALPIRFEPYMHDLLVSLSTTVWRTLYTLEWAVGFNPFVEYGLPLGFSDPALMHTFVGCADTFLSYFARNNLSAKALWHLQEAVSIVNNRIATATAGPISEKGNASASSSIESTTLIMVAGIAMFERGHGVEGKSDNWALHMKGLRELVNYQGGIERIFDQPYAVQKILRADLYGSLENDEPPYFDGESICRHLMGHGLSGISSSLEGIPANGVLTNLHLMPVLQTCVQTLAEAKEILFGSSKGGGMRVNNAVTATRLRYLLTGTQYTLLSRSLRRSLAAGPDSKTRHLGETYRIGLLLFSLCILNERPAHMNNDIQLLNNLKELMEEEGQLTSSDVQIWTLVMAKSVLGIDRTWQIRQNIVPSKCWVLEAFATKFLHGGLDFNHLQRRLQQNLWLPESHNGLLHKMCTAALNGWLDIQE